MRYTLTILESDFEKLRTVLSRNPNVENAAYLIARTIRTATETRLLVRAVKEIRAEEILECSPTHMKIKSSSYIRELKAADNDKGSLIFVHTHPKGHPDHSPQDDAEEASLFRTAFNRVHNDGPHASLIVCDGTLTAGRVWLDDGAHHPLELARIIGRRFQFISLRTNVAHNIPEFFDRQVRAFGKDLQLLLQNLHVGVVGAGGTGSAVIQQLTRLGVGQLSIFDGEALERSNINRVYGSRAIDDQLPKTKIAQRSIADIGLGTTVNLVSRSITYPSSLSALKDCDIIFGCTDDAWGRSILTRLAVYYLLPVIDMGVKIDSDNGKIRSVQGRVSLLMPGASCLYCRKRITSDQVAIETLWASDPEAAAKQVADGYIPELGEPAPAVIAFTSAIASSAITEFLDRLTEFKGAEQNTFEILHRIDQTEIRRLAKPAMDGCWCMNSSYFARGDRRPPLDITWRNE